MTASDRIHTIADLNVGLCSPKSLSAQSPNGNAKSMATVELSHEPGNAQEEQNPSQFNLNVLTFGFCLCALIVSLDTTILATVTPTITATFHSLDDIGWYGSVYLLTQTSTQPIFGKIYNLFNIKWTFLSGLAVFELGSVLCATATSSNMLILGRAISGLGGSAIFSGGMNIIAALVPLKKRAPYIAVMSSMLGISSLVGPALGGALTDHLGWRWCFWINLPCGGFAFIVILLFLRPLEHRVSSNRTLRQYIVDMDPLGSIFLVSGITTFLLGIQWGVTESSWRNGKVWGSLLVAGVSIILFSFIQWKLADRASIPPRIFYQQRTIFSLSLFSCFLSMAFYVHVYYLPVYFQAVRGDSAGYSGIHVIPYQASNTIASLVSGLGIRLIGWHMPFIWSGSIFFVIGSGLLYRLTVNTAQATLVGYQILTGFGFGASVQLPYIAVQAVSKPDDISSANAIMIFFHSIGGTISLGLAQTIFLASLRLNLTKYAPSVDAVAIIAAGPTGLRDITTTEQLPGVLEAYNKAISQTFIFPIATGGVAFLSSLFSEWRDIRKRDLSTTT